MSPVEVLLSEPEEMCGRLKDSHRLTWSRSLLKTFPAASPFCKFRQGHCSREQPSRLVSHLDLGCQLRSALLPLTHRVTPLKLKPLSFLHLKRKRRWKQRGRSEDTSEWRKTAATIQIKRNKTDKADSWREKARLHHKLTSRFLKLCLIIQR